MFFAEKMLETAKALENLGFEPILPKTLADHGKVAEELVDTPEELKILRQKLHRNHFDKIKNSDAVVVVNEEKNNIRNYLGASTFSEIAYAFYLKKPIFFINPIPEGLMLTDEIKLYEPIILKNIEQIKQYFFNNQ